MSISSIFQMIFETLSMTIISLGLAYLFGMPIGLILNITSKKGLKPCKSINFVLSSIVNVLRSIPCLIIVVLLTISFLHSNSLFFCSFCVFCGQKNS